MTKAIGKDINNFYNNGWPDKEAAHEDFSESVLTWNGESLALANTKEYDLDDFGYIEYPDGDARSFSEAFIEWFNSQTTKNILLTVKKEDFERAQTAIKTALSAAGITTL